MKLNEQQTMTILRTMQGTVGTSTNDTVNQALDPTSRTRWNHKVWLYPAFEDDGKTRKIVEDDEGDQPPCPIGEMITLDVQDIWGTEIHITLESGKRFKAYYDRPMGGYGQKFYCADTFPVPDHKTPCFLWDDALVVKGILETLLMEGDWSGKDPREEVEQEDCYGCLADYE